MAVIYVAIDQYLKDGGKMLFLLPWKLLKSRRFEITRNEKYIPTKVARVDNFGDVRIFFLKHTVRTCTVYFIKGEKTELQMTDGIRIHIMETPSISSASDVGHCVERARRTKMSAEPVDKNDP